MHRRTLAAVVALAGLLTLGFAHAGTAQESSFATSEAMPTQGPREIAPGVTIESITRMDDPRDVLGFIVGLQRITIEPGAVFDLVAVLGHGYAGPVQFYVEQGVMTIQADPDRPLGYGSDSITSMTIPAEGRVDVPADVAVYASDGQIGPVSNNGAEPLVILAIIVAPDPLVRGEVTRESTPST